MWFSGLRGAIAYALSLHLEFEKETRRVLVTTTLVIVLFTIFVLGGSTMPLLKFLKSKLLHPFLSSLITSLLSSFSLSLSLSLILRVLFEIIGKTLAAISFRNCTSYEILFGFASLLFIRTTYVSLGFFCVLLDSWRCLRDPFGWWKTDADHVIYFVCKLQPKVATVYEKTPFRWVKRRKWISQSSRTFCRRWRRKSWNRRSISSRWVGSSDLIWSIYSPFLRTSFRGASYAIAAIKWPVWPINGTKPFDYHLVSLMKISIIEAVNHSKTSKC